MAYVMANRSELSRLRVSAARLRALFLIDCVRNVCACVCARGPLFSPGVQVRSAIAGREMNGTRDRHSQLYAIELFDAGELPAILRRRTYVRACARVSTLT